VRQTDSVVAAAETESDQPKKAQFYEARKAMKQRVQKVLELQE